MNRQLVPPILRERLGPEASEQLLDLFDTARSGWRNEVIEVCSLRFERRLAEEIGKVRVDMVQGDAALRQEVSHLGTGLRSEMAQLGSSLRVEMAELGSSLRGEMAELGSSLRGEMAELGTGLKDDMAGARVELVKWCFLFWVGQLVALASIVGLVLRAVRP